MNKRNFADELIKAIRNKKNPCVVGLDPRIDWMPEFIVHPFRKRKLETLIKHSIFNFNKIILDTVAPLVPAVKLQIAFYEQYGLSGLSAFKETIQYAKRKGMMVIVDAKRNDIDSTATAYANALLGSTSIFNKSFSVFDADCITVSPYLGRDSILPFVKVCKENGKGIFILVKTSNQGSKDIQDIVVSSNGKRVYHSVAELVNELAVENIGKEGYSSIGAVVGATFPDEALELRGLLPRSIFLVPGYGSQGGTANSSANCFNIDGLGAVINASRSITYSFSDRSISKKELIKNVHENITLMINDINEAKNANIRKRI